MGRVVLGLPGPWAENFLEKSDHYTTKIGGLPDWPISDMFIEPDLLKCVLCGKRLCLLAQIYSPIKILKSNFEERVIYVFGCLTPKCGSDPKCWRALRVQKCNCEDDEILQDSKSSSNRNEDGRNFSMDYRENVRKNLDSGDEEICEEAAYDDIDFSELAQELSEASSRASQPKKQKGSFLIQSAKKSIQTKLASTEANSSTPVVACFYLYPLEVRPLNEVSAICADCSSLSIKQEDDLPNDMEEDEMWEGEGYEYDKALGADRTYLKFKKSLDEYPEQCFRYSYGGKPLLAKTDFSKPPSCNVCGSLRQPEMQLMPPLLYFLHEAADGSSAMPPEWNWATLLVYTCSSNCCPCSCAERPGSCCRWAVVEEAIVIQDE